MIEPAQAARTDLRSHVGVEARGAAQAQRGAAAELTRTGDTGAKPPGGRRRLVSLDVARGLMLVVSVGVNAWLTMPAWVDHAPWAGVHLLDLVFPVFVTLSGCGLAFAFARRVAMVDTTRRVIVLLLAGFGYNAVGQWLDTGSLTWAGFRLPGVLQLYAALVLVMAILHLLVARLLRTERMAARPGLSEWGPVLVWPVITLVLAGGYTWWLASFAAGCPGGELLRECNPSAVIDPAVFGAGHIYHQGRLGHDPEGVVALVGAVVATAGGASVGHVLLARQLSMRVRLSAALSVIAAFAVSAALAAEVVAPMKRLWTPPFSLGVAAGCGLTLLALHVLLDARTGDHRSRVLVDRLVYPLVALGRNSLLVYFGSHLVMHAIAPGVRDALDDQAVPLFVAGVVAAWAALACLLHSRMIYLRP